MQIKQCTRCKLEQPISNYRNDKNNKSGKTLWCKKCLSGYRSKPETRAAYLLKNKARIAEKAKDRESYYKKIRDDRRRSNIEESRDKARIYREKNRDKINKYYSTRITERKNSDPVFRVAVGLRTLVCRAFKKNRWKRTSRNEKLLGCSFYFAKFHIESQFLKGMNWTNHGNGTGKWNIDHMVPISLAKNEAQLEMLCHYTNLRPLWAIDNIIKGNKIFSLVYNGYI